MHTNNNNHLDMRKRDYKSNSCIKYLLPQPKEKKRNKKSNFHPLKGRKEIDEEDRPDLIHVHAMPCPSTCTSRRGGGQTIRILEFRPGLARSWRLWSKNVPIYRTERKKRRKNVVPNARFPFLGPCICGVPGISYSQGLDRYLRATS